jgi:hypothetical protein
MGTGMKPKFSVDDSGFKASVKGARITQQDMKEFGNAGSSVIKSKQKTLVPVDTAATKTSIGDHYGEISATYFEDDIGPETDYAPNIEYGRADMPNYPIQPFVVPSATGESVSKVNRAIGAAFKSWLTGKWQT